MNEQEIIALLVKQNEKLMTIIEKFAEKELKVVVNSYNNTSSCADIENKPSQKTDNRTTKYAPDTQVNCKQ